MNTLVREGHLECKAKSLMPENKSPVNSPFANLMGSTLFVPRSGILPTFRFKALAILCNPFAKNLALLNSLKPDGPFSKERFFFLMFVFLTQLLIHLF